VLLIRHALKHDAPAMLEIYRPYVERTIVSFETQAPSIEEFAARITKALQDWTWLIAEEHGRCVGYASGSAHRERLAYRWSVETSVYVHDRHHRRGIGKALYAELFERLGSMGYCNAYAGIALPNDASFALHRLVGFEPIGTFSRVGRKFGTWHDVLWLQRRLRESPPSEGPMSEAAT
jgi:L-amino acid N-acyltransferase YncA